MNNIAEGKAITKARQSDVNKMVQLMDKQELAPDFKAELADLESRGMSHESAGRIAVTRRLAALDAGQSPEWKAAPEMATAEESEIAYLELELESIADARIPRGTNPSDVMNQFRTVLTTAELDARERNLKRRLVALKMQPLNVNDVVSVYEGEAGQCCCGCSGEYFYSPTFTKEIAGYVSENLRVAPTSTQFNQERINTITALVNKHIEEPRDIRTMGEGFYILELNSRKYFVFTTVYFSSYPRIQQKVAAGK